MAVGEPDYPPPCQLTREPAAANPPASRPTGETTSSEAEPDVQEQTGANQPGEDGRHYLRDILPRVVRGPPGHRAVTGGRRPSPPDPRRPVCLSQRPLLEDDPQQAFHPPPPAPDLSQHELPAAPVDVDSDQQDGNCPGSKPHARFHGRGNSHSPEKESIDRITAKEVAVDGTSPNENQSWE